MHIMNLLIQRYSDFENNDDFLMREKMNQSLGLDNRRKFPRFSPNTDLFVLYTHFGKIINISMGGALFTYCAAERENISNSAPAKGVLFARDDEYLLELPFKTVYEDVEQIALGDQFNTLRKRAIVFDDLSTSQVDQLEQFILDNVRHPVELEEFL
jgi:hypothetical protein